VKANNADRERITVQVDHRTKAEMEEVISEHSLSYGWIVRRAWELFKEALATGRIKL